MMSKNNHIKLEEIEFILEELEYFDLAFNYYSEETNVFWYEGYLDTEYRIQIKIIDENTLEIWDCDYYVDNFVRAGIAKRNEENFWVVLEG